MNEHVTQQLRETTALSGGVVSAPGVPEAARLRRDVMAKPFHSNTESTLAPTSEFARYFLLALPARYVPRGIISAPFEDGSPGWLKNLGAKLIEPFVKSSRAEVDAVLSANPLQGLAAGQTIDSPVVKELLNDPSNKPLKENLAKVLGKWNASANVEDIVEYAYKNGRNGKVTTKSMEKVGAKIATNLSKRAYGIAVGVGSLALTSSYAGMVYRDIKNLFAEAVGFEFNKAPEDVNFNDILRSKNDLVKLTLDNFWKKTAGRLVTDLPFFAVLKYPSVNMVDALIGAKAGMLFAESWRRRNTMFEDLVKLVNDKINPYNGLGQPITTADIFDLYQHYHYNKKSPPSETFNTIIERETNDSITWARSQRVFSRIADLMNQTYAYKHESELDANGNLVIRANFALPQFMYLLGHNLINPRDPEHTLAYIETANSYGMQAVKEVQRMFALGAPVEAVIRRFPVDRNLPSNANLHPEHPLPDPQQPTTLKPNTKIQGEDRALEGRTLASGLDGLALA